VLVLTTYFLVFSVRSVLMEAEEHEPFPVVPPRYHVLKKLGFGAFGSVFEARDVQSDRLVAIKHTLAKSSKEEDFMNQELLVLKSIQDCDHVVRLFDSFSSAPNELLIVLELLPVKLAVHLAGQVEYSEGTVARILGQVWIFPSLSFASSLHLLSFHPLFFLYKR
jgi:serine/threonine protein kinase